MEILTEFKDWLTKKGTRTNPAISNAVSRVKRIMEYYDIDGWYRIDQCQTLQKIFEYPKKAEKMGLRPLIIIPFNTERKCDGIHSLKNALNLYIEFLKTKKI